MSSRHSHYTNFKEACCSTDMEGSHVDNHQYPADGSYFATASFSHGSSPLPNASANKEDWRWRCCNCDAGANNSYIFDDSCVDCGHTKCSGCEIWTMK